MRIGFRGRVFLATFTVAAAALLLLATLVSRTVSWQTSQRIQQSLVSEARLVADLLARHPGELAPATLDAEADRVGAALPARVTFIAPDGSVVGDSMVDVSSLGTLENHGSRPEVVAARAGGTGVARRYSHTLGTDMLYVAMRTPHPLVATVRLALPLTEIDQQLAAVRRGALVALATGIAGALALAWLSSALLARRLNALALAARRYASGDLSQPLRDFENDQVGTVARALDEVVRQLVVRVEELDADRARTEAILAGMVEGVVVVDTEGRIRLVNRAARAMLGMGDAGPLGGDYLDLVRHPEISALLTDAIGGRDTAGLEISPVGQAERRVVARAAPVGGAAGNGTILVLHDITDLRRADQVRRDFVANVSHELRTPLTAIRGYVEALADEPDNAENRAKFLAVISRHAARMERLVRDLLRLASLEARQETVERAPCHLDEVFDGVVSDLAPAIEARRQRIETRVAAGLGPIHTDAAKLQDVLRNLVENAVNYSPEGRLIRLDAAPAGDSRIIITVGDEGPGIPAADLERIFERFYRVDKARSRESGGTGLGLSIVKHLVDLLGGSVRAANRPEGGAVFSVQLPLDAPGAGTGARAAGPGARPTTPS